MIAPTEPDQPAELRETRITEAELQSGDGLEGVHICDLDLAAVAATGVRIVESTLERIDLSGSRLPNLTLIDVRLDSCNLANVDGRGGSMHRVLARNCRLTGVQWTEAGLRDVTVADSGVDLAGFAASSIESASFENCVLRETSFQEATLRSVRFVACDLAGADFSAATVTNCEMRDCTIDGVRGVERLRGVRMPWSDVVASAGTFAHALGIAVIED